MRKIVTILISSVVDDTDLGERLDPESLHRLMSRHFELSTAVVERHGGTVEPFAGDGVMACSVCRRCTKTMRYVRYVRR